MLAKRPLANAAWRHESPPDAQDVRTYWERARTLAFDPAPMSWPELAVRFAAFAEGVSSALVGTSSLAHLTAAADAVERGALDVETRTRLDAAWAARAQPDWHGVI